MLCFFGKANSFWVTCGGGQARASSESVCARARVKERAGGAEDVGTMIAGVAHVARSLIPPPPSCDGTSLAQS
eukprot:scaffold31208_cov67-Isochrysis_galbana.AAC.1